MKILFNKKCILIGIIFLCSSLFIFPDSKYKVQKGDTLYSISKKYQITVAELRTANNLSENDVIKIGQTLTIPSADISNAVTLSSNTKNNTAPKMDTKDYVIQKGDTLYGIAKKNNMSLNDLLAINKLDNNSVIKVGQKIKVKQETKVTQTTQTSQPVKTTPVDTRTGNKITVDSSVIWPVKNPKVTSIKGKVRGVQLSAQKNETVKCIREGTVMYVGLYRGYGQVLFVQSKTGVIYAYAGLNSISVKKGEYVLYDAHLGTAGIDSITGNSQITFMVFQNGQAIDPVKAPRH